MKFEFGDVVTHQHALNNEAVILYPHEFEPGTYRAYFKNSLASNPQHPIHALWIGEAYLTLKIKHLK